MSTTLRVGVIGCGSIAAAHIRGYLDSNRYEIVALADLEEAAMAEQMMIGLSAEYTRSTGVSSPASPTPWSTPSSASPSPRPPPAPVSTSSRWRPESRHRSPIGVQCVRSQRAYHRQA